MDHFENLSIRMFIACYYHCFHFPHYYCLGFKDAASVVVKGRNWVATSSFVAAMKCMSMFNFLKPGCLLLV